MVNSKGSNFAEDRKGNMAPVTDFGWFSLEDGTIRMEPERIANSQWKKANQQRLVLISDLLSD